MNDAPEYVTRYVPVGRLRAFLDEMRNNQNLCRFTGVEGICWMERAWAVAYLEDMSR